MKRKQFSRWSFDQALMIWLALISATIISLLAAESGQTTIAKSLIVCGIVILKGRWVIEHFMGLKNAAPVTRWMVSLYFYLMTSVVGLSVVYSQLLVVH